MMPVKKSSQNIKGEYQVTPDGMFGPNGKNIPQINTPNLDSLGATSPQRGQKQIDFDSHENDYPDTTT